MIDAIRQYRGILFVLLVVAILAGMVALQVLRPSPGAQLLDSLTPAATPEPTPTPGNLRVYVSGAVKQPDVYVLKPDSIVKDALLAAGGAAPDADLDRINLAQTLVDGLQIYVPRRGEENPPVPLVTQPTGPLRSQQLTGGKVNVNAADAAELETLPGIGPVTAQHIVEYRQAHGPFSTIEEIMEVSGIGPSTYEKIQALITTK